MRTYLVAGLVMLLLACNKKQQPLMKPVSRIYILCRQGVLFETISWRGESVKCREGINKNNFPNGGIQV